MTPRAFDFRQLLLNEMVNNNLEQTVLAVAMSHKSYILLPEIRLNDVIIVIVFRLSPQNVINIPVISWEQKYIIIGPIQNPS